MRDRNSDPIQNTLDFAILNSLSQQSLDIVAIERYIQRVRAMLEFAAARKGIADPGSTDAALWRLQKVGWVESVHALSAANPSRVYALTCEGRKQLEMERTRRESVLANFVESDSLDDSFLRFLNVGNN